MKLIDIITAAGSRIAGGDPYTWNCYGADANFIEFRDTDGEPYAHAVHDTKNDTIYEIHIEVPGQDQAFRWVNPDFKQAMYLEAQSRGVNPDMAWDSVNYTHVETEELILEYLKDIGETYYDNLPIVENSPTNSFTMPMPGTMGTAKLTFPEDDMNTYNVGLDVRYELEVKADSMDEAVEKARQFQETMPKGWGEHNNFEVCWIDTVVVKETVEHNINI